MTDLTNDATLNLSNGASGTTGTGATGSTSTTGSYATSTSDLGQSPGMSSGGSQSFTGEQSFSGGQSGSGQSSAVQDFALNTSKQLEGRANQARDWAMSQSDTVRTQVLEKPFISVGAAFASGIIFGLLLRR